MRPFRIVAHRGYSARYPENTVTGARAAIAAGADLVEADARLSADGTVFCFHDATLSRLTGNPAAIADCSDEVLRSVRYAGDQPASLDQILSVVAGRAGLLVDVKLGGPEILAALARLIAAAGWPDGVWLGLRSAEQIASARTLFDDRVSIVALMPALDQAEACLSAGADALRIWEAQASLPEAQALRARAPIWVTAGATRGLKVGDTDAAGLQTIGAYAPAAVLLNDPTLVEP
jgi:glycerophosphoryl diester phosphodiesterase